VWGTPIGEVRHSGGGYPGPRSTPTIDLGKVYALGLNGDLVWPRSEDRPDPLAARPGEGFGGEIPNWGYAESP